MRQSTVVRKKPRLNAAEQHVNRGAAKGGRARVGGVPESTEASKRDESAAATSIKAQASCYLGLIGKGACHVMLPASTGSPLLRLYMTTWDHNGLGRTKPLGKPDKTRALLEQAWWNTLGVLSCTCHRGRLTEDAPCVYKLTMAALSESWLKGGFAYGT